MDCRTVCRKCKEKYHFARNCKGTKKNNKFRKGDKSHHVEESSETDERDESNVEIAFVSVGTVIEFDDSADARE